MRLILITVIVLMFCGSTLGQRRTNKVFKSGAQRLRHVQGYKGIDGSYGISQLGSLYSLGGMFYMLDNNSVRVKGLFENGSVVGNPLKRYNVDVIYAYSPIDLSGFVFVNLLGGVCANISYGAFGEELNIRSGINFGALAGIEVEAFIAGTFSFFISADQRVHVYDNYGRWRNYSQVGLRYNFK